MDEVLGTYALPDLGGAICIAKGGEGEMGRTGRLGIARVKAEESGLRGGSIVM